MFDLFFADNDNEHLSFIKVKRVSCSPSSALSSLCDFRKDLSFILDSLSLSVQ